MEYLVNEGVKVGDLIKAISDRIGHEWKQLARTLKFLETDVHAIEHDNKYSLKEQIFQLFYQWERNKGNDATSEVLLEGLVEAKLDDILESLKGHGLIQLTGGGRPIQETTLTRIPEQPKLMGMMDGDAEDVEVDETKTKPVSKPSPKGPEDDKRHRIRVKRLVRHVADQTGEGPFHVGRMVHVESIGYGVVKWIGLYPRTDKLIAGIEFEEHVPGGHSGVLDGTAHFTCDPGFGLFLLYHQLKNDARFPTSASPVKSTTENLSPSKNQSNGASPMYSKTEDQSPATVQSNSAPSVNSDSCAEDTESVEPLVFCIPNDRAGLVIGKDGKNILEVERATNTIIKVDSRKGSLGDKRYAVITGSAENRKKAFLMITQKLQRRVNLHTATSEAIKVPDDMVGRIIGKNGVTIEGIKSLSGAHSIEFSDRPVGLQGLLNAERDCTITGSHDQIQEAKKLVHQVLGGEDIVTSAYIAALMMKLEGAGMGLEDENSGCILS